MGCVVIAKVNCFWCHLLPMTGISWWNFLRLRYQKKKILKRRLPIKRRAVALQERMLCNADCLYHHKDWHRWREKHPWHLRGTKWKCKVPAVHPERTKIPQVKRYPIACADGLTGNLCNQYDWRIQRQDWELISIIIQAKGKTQENGFALWKLLTYIISVFRVYTKLEAIFFE